MNTEIVRSSNLGPSAFGPARNVQNNKLGLGSGLTLPLGLARPSAWLGRSHYETVIYSREVGYRDRNVQIIWDDFFLLAKSVVINIVLFEELLEHGFNVIRIANLLLINLIYLTHIFNT